jgi:hypothetical protein
MARRLLRAVWAVTALAIAGAAVAAIVTVVEGDFGDTDGQTIFALLAVFLCGGAAIAALHLVEGRLPLLGLLVLIAAAAELVLFQLGIWKGQFGNGYDDWAKLVPIMLAWVIATIVLATMPLIAGRRALFGAVPAVGALGLVGATIATVMIWRESGSEAWGKTLAVLAILMVAGYLLTPLAERLLRAQARRA